MSFWYLFSGKLWCFVHLKVDILVVFYVIGDWRVKIFAGLQLAKSIFKITHTGPAGFFFQTYTISPFPTNSHWTVSGAFWVSFVKGIWTNCTSFWRSGPGKSSCWNGFSLWKHICDCHAQLQIASDSLMLKLKLLMLAIIETLPSKSKSSQSKLGQSLGPLLGYFGHCCKDSVFALF